MRWRGSLASSANLAAANQEYPCAMVRTASGSNPLNDFRSRVALLDRVRVSQLLAQRENLVYLHRVDPVENRRYVTSAKRRSGSDWSGSASTTNNLSAGYS